ncbi:MAG: Crp/Fnr family transcriptional regulator [Thiotrichales bacterium]
MPKTLAFGLSKPRAEASPYTRCAECPVRAMALFSKVPAESLNWAQEYRRSQGALRAREHLFMQGERTEFVYTLFLGWMKIYKTSPSGRNQILRFALPGDFLGFQGDIGGPVGYSAQALTNCVVCAFPRNRIMELLGREPAIAAQLITMNARSMSICQEYLLSSGARDTRESIAFLLLELFHRLKIMQRFRPEPIEDNAVDIPITQDDIAEAVGVTPIHVNRILQQMKQDGLLRCANHRLEILDEPALTKLAHFDPTSIGYSAMV